MQLVLCFLGAHTAKVIEDSEAGQEKKAIIAIQIVDPSDKTDGKNTKRTIESSLGYGYQISHPIYQLYKYSQHDIPPYKEPSIYQNGQKTTGMYIF